MTEAEIEKMFPWGKKETVPTRKGLRYRRQIRKPSRQSVALYSLHKASLTGEGVVYSEYPLGSGNYSLTWWQHVSKEEEDRRRKAQALSEATDGQIVVPAPAELAYRPFQRTFVQFVLNGLGVDVNRMIPGQAPDERAFQGLFGMPMLPAEQRRTGFLLGDEMGLGKSIQAIALINGINGIAGRKTLGKILYICPAGLKNNTVRELRRWLTNTYTIGIADGGMFPSSEIVVINYQVLHKWEKELTTDWDIIFIDEAQNLRNDTARMTQHALGYKGSKESPARPQIPAKLRIAMSGTPAVNRVAEMWTILNWLDPISFGDKWRFEQKYCAASKASGWYSNKGSSNEAQLQALLKSTIMIRRLKRDVAKELPPKQRQLMILPNEGGKVFDIMSDQLANWVQKMAVARANLEWAKTTDDPGEYERACQKLQDAIDSGSSVTSPLRIESAQKKLPLVIPILEEAAETAGKIIVCAYHRFAIEELTRAFHGKCMTVYGGIPAAQRQQLVDRFQNDPTCKYAVLSIPTAVGMTLTAASMVYFVEEDWIPGNITQAEDRCIAEGQPVLTLNGWVKIEDVKIGDLVIDRYGNPAEVIDAWNSGSTKLMTEMTVEGWPYPIISTSDHRFLTQDKGWIEAGKMIPGDRLEMPGASLEIPFDDALKMQFPEDCRIPNSFVGSKGIQRNGRLIKAPEWIEVSDDFLFVCGYFAGDGFASIKSGKGRFLSFSGNTGKKVPAVERCRRWATSVGIFTSKDCPSSIKGTETRSYSGEWANFFSATFGEKAAGKRLPEWILRLNRRQSEIVLEGLIASDGYIRSGRSEYSTVSDVLAANVATLMMRCGKRPCVTHPEQAGGWVVAFSDSSTTQSLLVKSVTHRFPKKTNGTRERVYDLTVKETSSFVVGMSVAHNCHRIGQTDSVNVIHLVLDKSIDMVMADQVMRKQKKLDLVFDVNEEKGRDEMEPVIPIPGFSASFKELAKESLRIGKEAEAARAMAQANIDPDDSNISDQLILDRFLRTKDPWPKLVALVSMMCAARSIPAPQPKPKSAPILSTPVRSLGLPGNRDSQAELTLA